MKEKTKGFDYFAALVRMGEYALEEAKLLREIAGAYDPDALEENHRRMHALEHACDGEKHLLTTALVRDFLPPIDRDDLFRLSHVTDNLTDSVESVTAFFYMADIRTLRADTTEFVDLIISMCQSAVDMLREFRNFKKSAKLKEYIITLNDQEEQGDRLYAAAMRRLSQSDADARTVSEWRSVYRNFENCCDAAESLADNIESVVMKNT